MMNLNYKIWLWDAAFIVGVVLFSVLKTSSTYNLIIGLITVQVFINCVKNHIAVYKLTGKAY
ncbi:hypothetical protein ACFQ3S_05605 [Mucilaginibacter terrae]|uniref:hypothetical protein n=1 Tax=Mucilaginibacter terrae TaxID=1955052 RepID=UPI003638EEBB